MIINNRKNNLNPRRFFKAPEECDPDPQRFEEKEEKKKHKESNDFKSALIELAHSSNEEDAIEFLSNKLSEAAKALGTDLNPIFDYIREHNHPNGRELLSTCEGGTVHTSHFSNPNVAKLWGNTTEWEKQHNDHEEEHQENNISNLLKANSLINLSVTNSQDGPD